MLLSLYICVYVFLCVCVQKGQCDSFFLYRFQRMAATTARAKTAAAATGFQSRPGSLLGFASLSLWSSSTGNDKEREVDDAGSVSWTTFEEAFCADLLLLFFLVSALVLVLLEDCAGDGLGVAVVAEAVVVVVVVDAAHKAKGKDSSQASRS